LRKCSYGVSWSTATLYSQKLLTSRAAISTEWRSSFTARSTTSRPYHFNDARPPLASDGAKDRFQDRSPRVKCVHGMYTKTLCVGRKCPRSSFFAACVSRGFITARLIQTSIGQRSFAFCKMEL